MAPISAPVTSLVAGGLGVVYAALQLRVGLYRLTSGCVFGTKDAKGQAEDAELTKITRVGANQGEYLPIGAILLLLLETSTDAPKKAVAAYGAAFALFRLIHAFGLENAYNSNQALHKQPRKYGFVGTVLLLVGGGSYVAFKAAKSLK